MKKATLSIFLIVLVIIIGLTQSYAFKAPDANERTQGITEKSGIKREKKGLSDEDITRHSYLAGLKTIHKRNLSLTIHGNDVDEAISCVDDLMKAAGTEAVLKRSHSDNLGYRHIRLLQRYKGLPVVGAELNVHINNLNVICQIDGKFVQDVNVSIKPEIDSETALQIGLDEHKGKAGLQVSKEPSLVVYGSHLAYHYVISYYEDADIGQWLYYVDAQTGKLILHYNNIQK